MTEQLPVPPIHDGEPLTAHTSQPPTMNWAKLLCSHNPFYVLSVCLVLYGIQVSFQGGAELADGWLLLKILGGYTILLMAAAVLIVRVGAVWEDARTIVLLVIVLIVALSASFDKVCLDSVATGRRIQLLGFAAAVGIVEVMLFGIRARLPWRYRGPLYSLFALLFYYPTWLGELSITGNEARMSWMIFLFPYFAATILLTLMPAAMNAGRGESPNGTPWRWPLYPWCGLAFIAVALAVRSFGLAVSFELSDGLQSAFLPYFLIPILLAVLWLVTELTLSSGNRQAASVLSYLVLGLAMLSLPGVNVAPVQRSFLRVVQENLASPLQLTCAMLIAYYAYCWLRRLPSGEWGVIGVGLLLSCSRPSTLTLDSIQSPQLIPGLALACVLLSRSFFCRCSLRYMAGFNLAFASCLSLPLLENANMPVWQLFAGSVFIAWITAGLLFRDRFAKFIRSTIHHVAYAVGSFTLVGGALRQPPSHLETALLLSLPTLLAFYWLTDPTVRRLTHAAVGVTLLVLHLGLRGYSIYAEQMAYLGGQRWLALGLLSLCVGIAVSMMKAGAAKFSRLLLKNCNRWLMRKLL